MFRLSPGRAEKGTYESDVRDAQTVSSWGAISWKGSAPAGHANRAADAVGQQPDARRHVEHVVRAVPHADGQQIVSPKARYLQWQATLVGKDATPVLTSVTAAYLQRNLRPYVTSITVYPAGNVFQKPYSTGEGEIAGFDDGWPDTRPSPTALAAAGTGAPAISLGVLRHARSDAESTRRDSRRSPGRPRTTTTTSSCTTSSTAASRRPVGRRFAAD